jgi:hypothetical protein
MPLAGMDDPGSHTVMFVDVLGLLLWFIKVFSHAGIRK